ncbi:MAG: ABC transporter permease [Spirochaetaceae bacterium]|jgi:phospholipid/cholesterol/gamma-HCH transport system permease protein|nr:ABC transporter permease [Spirochaetaceae bacterium]
MITATGQYIREKCQGLVYVMGYFGAILRSLPAIVSRGKSARRIVQFQILFTCVEALPVVIILALALGTAVHIVGYQILVDIGYPDVLYTLLVLLITRELGPLLTAFIVTARSSTAIAIEIAGMVIDHEIEAFISIGINPIEHLVVPRFIGVTISLILLMIYFSIFGLVCPFLIIQFFNPISAGDYFTGLLQALTLRSFGVSIIKGLLFGMVISVAGTYFGFAVERATTEVPQAGLKSASVCSLLVVVTNVFVSVLSYIL